MFRAVSADRHAAPTARSAIGPIHEVAIEFRKSRPGALAMKKAGGRSVVPVTTTL
jgi:hypothetical protein